eukprot:CAMPEP_0174862866 /NCGR_PEP_ID=MMETSP1114-20130205/55028_1 /TAXON_ID=312471 /ORGANISM="Neobodo designis, Strain CCAP 1951/1" /LENGTH=142 /DNA_ID=CAMNT_0016097923 /DNA_START=52 /DNA_END=477 /DNA_ORIENTATION=+
MNDVIPRIVVPRGIRDLVAPIPCSGPRSIRSWLQSQSAVGLRRRMNRLQVQYPSFTRIASPTSVQCETSSPANRSLATTPPPEDRVDGLRCQSTLPTFALHHGVNSPAAPSLLHGRISPNWVLDASWPSMPPAAEDARGGLP